MEVPQDYPGIRVHSSTPSTVPDSVSAALAEALAAATRAGRWDVVAQLARELEARRLTT